jgi:protein O-mannosyl-transferase
MKSADRRSFALLCIVLAAITVAAYVPSLDNGFVNRDDPACVTDNLDIRGYGRGHIAKIFSTVYLNHYLPATMLTYMAEYGLFGLDARGYHAVSLLLHSINVLLVFALFYGMSKNLFVAVATTLLFGIHPLRVEAVAWVSERKEVLSALFYFLSLLLYLKYRKKNSRKFYVFSFLALLVSLLSKTMSVSQPFVLLLMDYLAGRKIDRRALVEKLPFFVLSAAFVVVALLTVERSYDIYPHYSTAQRVLAPAYAIAFYLVKFIAPLNLCASYYPSAVPDSGMTLAMVLAGIAVPVIGLAVYASRRRTKTAVFGSLFFLVTLLPVLQIVNSGGLVPVADRYAYIPLLGMTFIAVNGFSNIMERFKNNTAVKTALYSVLVAGGSVLFVLTWQRCGVWKNGVTLWGDIIRKNSDAAQAYYGRGSAYLDRGEYRNAMADFNREIELRPDYASGYFGRGYLYCAYLGKADSGIVDLLRAVELSPDYPDAWNTLGIAEGMKDAFGKSIGCFDRALSLKPDFVEAYVNRGTARMKGFADIDGAAGDFTQAITLDPSYAKAYLMRGIASGAKGLFDGAIADFTMAIRLDPKESADAVHYRAELMAKKAAAPGRRPGAGGNGR